MRKLKVSLTIALLFASYCGFSQTDIYNDNFSQDAQVGWFTSFEILRGGTQIGAIGTDGINKLQFFTGSVADPSTTRLTIDASGRIGIGVNNPNGRFTIKQNGDGWNDGLRIDRDASNYLTLTEDVGDVRLKNWGSGGIILFTSTSEALRVLNNGKVGIGTTTPVEKLDVNGSIRLMNSGNKIYWDWPSRTIEQYSSGAGGTMIRFRNSMTQGTGNPDGGFDFADHNGKSVMRIKDYKVAIGTTDFTGNHKLRVEGSIGAREIKVEASGWSDFVFEKDYKLRTLDEVEQHINQNGHLPEIPSEAEVKENGINLGEMNAKLLQKIEELTLYMIDMNKRVDQLEQENTELKAKNKN